MRSFQKCLIGAVCLAALFTGCKRDEAPASGSNGSPGTAVADDLKGVAKQTEKTAKDIGNATAELADKAGQQLQQLSDQAGEKGQDAWITTKVKSALTGQGLDPFHVHVDTDQKVVTLSGTVPSAAHRDKAVAAAKTVKEAVAVKDHLVVKAE